MATTTTITHPTNIPFLTGKTVQLQNLNTQNFNGRIGIVQFYHLQKKRFAVQLHFDSSTRLFKACNLVQIQSVKSTPQEMIVLSEIQTFLCSADHANIEKGKNLFFEKLNFDVTNIVHFGLILTWFKTLWPLQIEKTTKEAIKIINKILRESPDCPPDFQMKFKTILVRHYGILPNLQKQKPIMKNLLEECLENHYGYISQILVQYLMISDNVEHKNVLAYIEEARYLILEKNYDSCLNQDNVNFFYVGALDYLANIGCAAKESFPTLTRMILNEISYFEEKICGVRFDSHLDIFAKGKIALMKNEYKKADKYFQKYQELILKKHGCQYAVHTELLEIRIHCYVKLKNKVMAKKCLKQLKKYFPPNHEEIVRQEKKIKKIGKRSKNISSPFKTLKKCCLPTCDKIEEEISQFQFCSVCKNVCYCCKKCQKLHWNQGHKKRCKTFQRLSV